ncbi:MAG: RloB family protein, partial [Rhodobacteraceae bacterium]|nr:RloB family protein [Paracoccaceae bacterium]
MGRKAKNTSPARRDGNKALYPRVLVVCEGEKTERYYFAGLRNHLRLRSANIEIVGEGATPTRIVKRAEKLHQEELDIGNPFDEIFCVFDKEEHADYDKAVRILEKKSSERKSNPLWWAAVARVPPFESGLLRVHGHGQGR